MHRHALLLCLPFVVSMHLGCAEPRDGDLRFAWGQRTQQLTAVATVGDRDDDVLLETHYGVGTFVADRVSVNVLGVGGAAVEDDRDRTVGLVGVDGILRLHTPSFGPISLFFDGGVGAQLTSDEFPGDSAHNFRVMAGPGFTTQLKDNLHLIIGVRYFHISNASTTAGNSAVDAAQISVGLIWAW